MRKYDESMPTPTDFRNLDLKIGIVLSILAFPVLFYFSLIGLLEKDPVPPTPISALVVDYSSFGFNGETFIRVELRTDAQAAERITLPCRAEDQRYAVGEEVLIVSNRDPSLGDPRYGYVLHDEYLRSLEKRRMVKNVQSGVVLLPVLLATYFWLRMRKRRRAERGNPFTAEAATL